MHSRRMGALLCLLLSMLIALCPVALPLHAVAEEENVIYYIEPELPSHARAEQGSKGADSGNPL